MAINALFLNEGLNRLIQIEQYNPATVIEQLPLTNREKEVMTHLLQGASYTTIASKLHISHSTVKTHCSNIYLKLNIKNRYELFNYCYTFQK